MSDYFSLGPARTDELHGIGDALLTPAEAAGYQSPLDSPPPLASRPSSSSNVARQIEEAASLLLGSVADGSEEEGGQEEGASSKAEKEVTAEAATRKAAAAGNKTLSPSQLGAVLGQELSPPPPASSRFLHGGPPLSDLEAPSVVLPNSERRNKPITSSEWRAFTDEEEQRLQEGWEALQQDKEALRAVKEHHHDHSKGNKRAAGGEKGESERKRAPEDDADAEDSPYLIPVGLDNLFTVSLYSRILYPAFWQGTPVRVILSHWFYAPPTSTNAGAHVPSHRIKPYPVDPSLSASLDRAYAQIRPWDTAYEAELASALKGGAEAQQRLSVPLGVVNEAGTDENLGIEVIFESGDRGRVYSKGYLGSMSKSFWSSGKQLGGGQVVLRGWAALQEYLAERARKKTPAKPAAPKDDPEIRRGRDRTASTSSTGTAASVKRPESPVRASPAKRSDSPAPGLFASLRNRLVGAPIAPNDPSSVGDPAGSARSSLDGGDGKLPNDTQEALQLSEEQIGVADELVLVVHGIGQNLAATYDSFSFTYAVNAFRSACTQLSQSDALSPLLHGKRPQFIPVLWRADLNFDEVDDSLDSADEHLANRFSLNDIEIQGSVPFLRQVVSGLVLDVPMYLSPPHKIKMIRSVAKEANRIYKLFVKRNPEFERRGGKVSIIAHSLGSCLAADILSNQPTSVKNPSASAARTPGSQGQPQPPRPDDLTFAFDTRCLFLVGSPLAFFLHLQRGQLIARAGRERTKRVGRDIALDRAGRYGCLACDTVYNVYHEADPVAFTLNAAVDARYAKLIKPVPIPSSTQTLLQNLSDAYHRVAKVFDMSSLWGGGTSTTGDPKQGGKEAKEQAAKQEEEKDKAQGGTPASPSTGSAKKGEGEKVEQGAMAAVEALKAASAEATESKRPGFMKRMPSERPRFGMGRDEFEWVARAEKRMRALNPGSSVDYFLPAEGLNQYIDALTAHQDYWTDRRFSTFVLTQLFSDESHLEKTGREEVGIEEEDESDI